MTKEDFERLTPTINNLSQLKPYIKNMALIEAINILERIVHGGLHYGATYSCAEILYNQYDLIFEDIKFEPSLERKCLDFIWDCMALMHGVLSPITPIDFEYLIDEPLRLNKVFNLLMFKVGKIYPLIN